MKALSFTCSSASWLTVAAARRFNREPRSLQNGYIGEFLKSRRARRASPAADEPDATPATRESANDSPTCSSCVCSSGSVYCEEVSPEMTNVPSSPKETSYSYARFNKIKKIGKNDFGDTVTSRRIDSTGNMISEIDDGAFSKLTMSEVLSSAENRLVKLPALPAKLTSFNANHNSLRTKGVKANAFKKLTNSANSYSADNQSEAVPFIPESVRILHLQNNNITEINTDTFCKSDNSYYLRSSLSEVRMDGNPVVSSKYPDSFTCMKVSPVGRYR